MNLYLLVTGILVFYTKAFAICTDEEMEYSINQTAKLLIRVFDKNPSCTINVLEDLKANIVLAPYVATLREQFFRKEDSLSSSVEKLVNGILTDLEKLIPSTTKPVYKFIRWTVFQALGVANKKFLSCLESIIGSDKITNIADLKNSRTRKTSEVFIFVQKNSSHVVMNATLAFEAHLARIGIAQYGFLPNTHHNHKEKAIFSTDEVGSSNWTIFEGKTTVIWTLATSITNIIGRRVLLELERGTPEYNHFAGNIVREKQQNSPYTQIDRSPGKLPTCPQWEPVYWDY